MPCDITAGSKVSFDEQNDLKSDTSSEVSFSPETITLCFLRETSFTVSLTIRSTFGGATSGTRVAELEDPLFACVGLLVLFLFWLWKSLISSLQGWHAHPMNFISDGIIDEESMFKSQHAKW